MVTPIPSIRVAVQRPGKQPEASPLDHSGARGRGGGSRWTERKQKDEEDEGGLDKGRRQRTALDAACLKSQEKEGAAM